MFFYKSSGYSGAGADDLKAPFIKIDNYRKAFAASHFGLRRGDDDAIRVADEKSRERVGRPFVVEKLDVFADFHAVLFGGLAHGNLTESSDRSGRHGFAAEIFKRGQTLLAEQHERATIDGCGNVDQVRAADISVNRGGAALVYIDLAGEECLRRCSGAQPADVDRQAAFAEVTRLVGQ